MSGPADGTTPGDQPTTERRPRRWLAAELWVVLTVVAGVHAVWILSLLLDYNDTEYLETTLAAVVAGQFVDGPSSLYGPYTLRNPRVLIQAPLYYRLAGLFAWPFVAAGFTPAVAAFIAGRAISLASFAGLVSVVYRLAQLDGGPRRAGTWAILLTLCAWLFVTYPATVRPDMLGIFLQTLGTFLVLRFVLSDTAPGRSLTWAYIAYALAACVKQHDVGSAVASTFLLASVWLRRKASRSAIERALLIGVMIVVCYYVLEEAITRGWMSVEVFGVPAALRRMSDPRVLAVVGMGLSAAQRSLVPLGIGLACLIAAPGAFRKERLDRLLLYYLVMELVLFSAITYRNEGGWVNYALQPVLYSCVLVSRTLRRVVALPIRFRRVVALAVLAPFLAYVDLGVVYRLTREKVSEEYLLNAMIHAPQFRGWLPSEIYFMTQPGYNRRYGRTEWIHDEWLYGKFERLRAVPPRSQWMRAGLTDGTIRFVIVPVHPPISVPVDPPRPLGLRETLPELGYDLILDVDRFRVWERRRPTLSAGAPGTVIPPPGGTTLP